jgi:hypothetical protein
MRGRCCWAHCNGKDSSGADGGPSRPELARRARLRRISQSVRSGVPGGAPSQEQSASFARPVRPHLQAQDRLCDPRSFATTLVPPQGRIAARPRPTGNPAQYECLGKRHPRIRHEKENIRRNRQRQRPGGSRRDAWSRQNLHETKNIILPLSRSAPERRRTPDSAPGKSHPFCAGLTINGPEICPSYC